MSTLGISQFPFAATLGRETASAAPTRRNNSFLSTLIDSAEKQSREEARREEMARAAQEAARKAIREAAPQMVVAHEPVDVPAAIRQVRPPSPMASNPLYRMFTWLNRKCALSATKQLRVAETVSLGDKRFVAVVHVAGQKFLIGGGAQGVSLLTQLDAAADQAAPALPGDAE